MIGMLDLWLPVLVAAVLVFVASFVIHAVLNFHFDDYAALPDEDGVAEAIRKAGVTPGNYVIPRAASRAEMQSDELRKKIERGPMVLMNVQPNGMPNMGKRLGSWFVYCVVVGFVTAYVTGRTLGADADYLTVFRVSGTVAFLTYAGAEPIQAIWFGRNWSATLRSLFDGLVYGLLTAGAFGWLWPA